MASDDSTHDAEATNDEEEEDARLIDEAMSDPAPNVPWAEALETLTSIRLDDRTDAWR